MRVAREKSILPGFVAFSSLQFLAPYALLHSQHSQPQYRSAPLTFPLRSPPPSLFPVDLDSMKKIGLSKTPKYTYFTDNPKNTTEFARELNMCIEETTKTLLDACKVMKALTV